MSSTLAWSAISFALGLLLGHWLSIDRERRKEFNSAVAPVREWLLREMHAPSPYSQPPTSAQLDEFQHYLSPLGRWRFQRVWAAQKRVRAQLEVRDDAGQVFYSDPSAVTAAVAACERVARRKR